MGSRKSDRSFYRYADCLQLLQERLSKQATVVPAFQHVAKRQVHLASSCIAVCLSPPEATKRKTKRKVLPNTSHLLSLPQCLTLSASQKRTFALCTLIDRMLPTTNLWFKGNAKIDVHRVSGVKIPLQPHRHPKMYHHLQLRRLANGANL